MSLLNKIFLFSILSTIHLPQGHAAQEPDIPPEHQEETDAPVEKAEKEEVISPSLHKKEVEVPKKAAGAADDKEVRTTINNPIVTEFRETFNSEIEKIAKLIFDVVKGKSDGGVLVVGHLKNELSVQAESKLDMLKKLSGTPDIPSALMLEDLLYKSVAKLGYKHDIQTFVKKLHDHGKKVHGKERVDHNFLKLTAYQEASKNFKTMQEKYPSKVKSVDSLAKTLFEKVKKTF